MQLKIVLSLVFIVSVLLFVSGCVEEKKGECFKVQTTCCPCSMGGKETCVSEEELPSIQEELKDCPPNLICPTVYTCTITSCNYIDGECVAEE